MGRGVGNGEDGGPGEALIWDGVGRSQPTDSFIIAKGAKQKSGELSRLLGMEAAGRNLQALR